MFFACHFSPSVRTFDLATDDIFILRFFSNFTTFWLQPLISSISQCFKITKNISFEFLRQFFPSHIVIFQMIEISRQKWQKWQMQIRKCLGGKLQMSPIKKKNHDRNETFLGRLSNTVLSGFFCHFLQSRLENISSFNTFVISSPRSQFFYGMKKSFGHFSKQKHLEPSAKFARAGVKIKFSFNWSKLLKVCLKRQKYFQTFHLAS